MALDAGTSLAAGSIQADFLRSYLAGRDEPCPNCAYNLRDLTGDRCPECGQELTLRVQLAEPRLAAFLTGLIGLSAGAGFSGLILIYWLIAVWIVRVGATAPGFVRVTLIGLAVQTAALLAWLRLRSRLRTLAPLPRWSLAAGCWVLSLANLVWFTLTIL